MTSPRGERFGFVGDSSPSGSSPRLVMVDGRELLNFGTSRFLNPLPIGVPPIEVTVELLSVEQTEALSSALSSSQSASD